MNERLIYEWLRPALRSKRWFLTGNGVGGITVFDADRHDGVPLADLPDLDMNTWHREVVVKLLPSTYVWFNGKFWNLQERVDDSVQANPPAVINANAYDALTEYLEGNDERAGTDD